MAEKAVPRASCAMPQLMRASLSRRTTRFRRRFGIHERGLRAKLRLSGLSASVKLTEASCAVTQTDVQVLHGPLVERAPDDAPAISLRASGDGDRCRMAELMPWPSVERQIVIVRRCTSRMALNQCKSAV